MTKAAARSSRKIAVGQRFSRLTAIAPAGHTDDKRPKPCWRFRCDCGNELVARSESVKAGNTISCGCAKMLHAREMGRRNRKHGFEGTRLYRIWGAMMRRCYYPQNSRFEYYGGRGIAVTDDWHKLETFVQWAEANGYADSLTIDRIDPNGNYAPSNCRWITIEDQQSNRRPPRKRPPKSSSQINDLG